MQEEFPCFGIREDDKKDVEGETTNQNVSTVAK